MQNYTDLPLDRADSILSVATATDLPTTGVVEGSIRYVEDVDTLYSYDGSAWSIITAGISAASVADTTSIDTTITLGVLTADLKLSNVAATSGNLKATTTVKGGTGAAQGLHVEIPVADLSTSTSGVTVSGTGAVLAAATIDIATADGANDGLLAYGDWNTFNGKQDVLPAADTSTDGYLTSTDWNTFDGKQDAITPADITGTANRLGVSGGTGAALAAVTLNVDATQFPNSNAANDGLPLVASSSDNTATWKLPQSTVDLQQSGFVSWGGSGNYYSLSSGTFTVLRAGVGRLSGSKITWAGGENVGSLAADKTYYIGYNATNTLVKIDAATIYSASPETYYENMHTMFIDNVILFTVWMDTVTPMVSHENHPYEYGTDISVHDHFRLGHVFTGTGAALSVLSSANATVQSIGEDRLDDHGLSSKVPDLTGAVLDVTSVFKNASGRAKRYNRRTFTVSGVSVTPTFPATYTNNGSTFTVLHTSIAAGSGTIICWTSAGTSLPQASGTLTKTSGTGDATITFSAYTSPVGCSSTYTPANVVTPLGTGGATRYGIWAVYLVKSDLQTPTTADPVPTYIWVPSMVAYISSATAALSLGTGTAPDMTQFQQSSDLLAMEPCLNGFVLMDGSTRIIPNYTGSGFTAGVRTFKATSAGQFSAGAVAVAAAINVATTTSSFTGWLSASDVNVQLALDTIATKSLRYEKVFNATSDWTSATPVYTITIAAATHLKGTRPMVQVMSGTTTLSLVGVQVDITAASGDVMITVPETPDDRFAGVVWIA